MASTMGVLKTTLSGFNSGIVSCTKADALFWYACILKSQTFNSALCTTTVYMYMRYSLPTWYMKPLMFQADGVDALLLWRELDVIQRFRQVTDLAQFSLTTGGCQASLHVEGVSP